MIIQANAIRTNLLIQASQELSLLSPQQRIKINSETFQEIASKFGKYIIEEKDVISSSPNKQCSCSFFESFDENSYINPFIGAESPIDLHIKAKKITVSQRKLGIPKQSPLESCSTLISTDQKTIQNMATKDMRSIAKSIKQCYTHKQRSLNQDRFNRNNNNNDIDNDDQHQQQLKHQIVKLKKSAKLSKHYSELNLLQKKLRTETKKCLDRVYFSLNKKKEIVIKTKENTTNNNINSNNNINNNSNCKNTPNSNNNNKSVIMLHRCSVTEIQSRSDRKKTQKEFKEHKAQKIKHSTRSNNINQIYIDFE